MVKKEGTEKLNAITRIRSRLLSLSDSERRAATWILEHTEEALYLSMSQIAQECEISDTTILRMCRNSGFKGFTDLKIALAQDLATPNQLIHENITPNDDSFTVARKVFLANIQSLYDTLEVLNEASLMKAVDLLENARHILIFGVGGSGIIAQSIYQRFSRLGLQCDAPQDVQLQIMHVALLEPGDLVIGVSYSGATKDVDMILQEGKKAGAATLCITGNAQSAIAKHADVVLVSVSHEIRSDPIAARVAETTLVDALYVLYSYRHIEKTLETEKKIANTITQRSY